MEHVQSVRAEFEYLNFGGMGDYTCRDRDRASGASVTPSLFSLKRPLSGDSRGSIRTILLLVRVARVSGLRFLNKFQKDSSLEAERTD